MSSGLGRVAVVTGANKGIGLSTVQQLYGKFEGTIYLTSRNEERGIAAVASIKESCPNVSFHQLDINDTQSIERLRDHLKQEFGGLDVLVNNAGIAFFQGSASVPKDVKTEVTVRTNYFGTLHVCEFLFSILRPHARVVNVSSSLGFLGHIRNEELKKKFASDALTTFELNALMDEYVREAKAGTHVQNGWVPSVYSMSKLGVSALTRIQQRLFDVDSRADLIVNHVHPGYVATDMTGHKGPLTVEEGAVSSVYAALLPPNVREPKGAFIWKDCSVVDWLNGPLPSAS